MTTLLLALCLVTLACAGIWIVGNLILSAYYRWQSKRTIRKQQHAYLRSVARRHEHDDDDSDPRVDDSQYREFPSYRVTRQRVRR